MNRTSHSAANDTTGLVDTQPLRQIISEAGSNGTDWGEHLKAPTSCSSSISEWSSGYFGAVLAVPQWEAIATAVSLSIIIIMIIVGNILVILSVFTHKPLRIVQNVFIVSLAVADLTVALLVLPLNVAYSILGRWVFGLYVCKLWLTCDIMCCTSSILHLCTIALDRYWAITDPINYAQKRTVGRVLLLITGVWLLSLTISSPPLFGWNNWPDVFTNSTPCQLNSDPGFVVYSALGSFYIPLVVMAVVYIEIYAATRRRLRERAEMRTSTRSNAPEEGVSRNLNDEPTATSLCVLCCRRSRPNPTASVNNKGNDSENSDVQCPNDDQCAIEQLGGVPANGTDRGKKARRMKTKDSLRCMKTMAAAAAPDAASAIKKPATVHHFILEKQKISLSKERRAARTLGVIMGVFVICWLPFFAMYVVLPFCASCCPTGRFKNFITWLGYINSVLNPIIYTIFNLDFRRAFKKLLGMH